MRRPLLAAAFLVLSSSPALAAGPDATCLFDVPAIAWKNAMFPLYPSWDAAAKAKRLTGGDPFVVGEGDVAAQRGRDLVVRGEAGVVVLQGVVPAGPALDHTLMSAASGPWRVVALASQERLEETGEDELPAHPEIDFQQWLIDGRTGRVALVTHEALPGQAYLEGPTLAVVKGRLVFEGADGKAGAAMADIDRCAGGDEAGGKAMAAAYVALGRKLTKDDPRGASSAFSQALAFDDATAEAWSGRGYARLQAYLEERKGQTAAIGHLGAREDFEKAASLSTDPKFLAQVWYNIGETYRLGCEAHLPEYQREPLGLAIAAYEKSLGYADREPVKKKVDEVKKRLAGLSKK